MAINYQELTFYTVSNFFNNENKNRHYERLLHTFDQNQVSLLRKFHIGTFHLSGTNHFMPEFLITEEAKSALNYPQGFLIMEADESYYTDRADLESYELRFTLSGEGTLQYHGQKYSLKKGDGYFINCRDPHLYYTTGTQWTSTIFHINGPAVSAIFNKYAADGNVKFTASSCPNFEMLQFQVLKTSQELIPYREYKISCLIDILLTELLTSKSEGPRMAARRGILPQVINYMEMHYSEEITLEQLTHTFGINRTKLCEEFKKYTGFTVKNYLLTLRINHAKRLLQSTPDSVEIISEEVGFHDTAHFIHLFKKKIGTTPLQFRKLHM